VTDDEVRRLIAQAREAALADVRELLRKRFTAELLEQVEASLAPARAAEPAEPATGDVLWVYGVSASDETCDTRGIDSAEVFAVRQDDLTAYASVLPAARFEREPLMAQLEDLERVEVLARAHEGVVEALREQAAVLPCRLCTIYSGEPALRAMLEREQETLRATLERLRDAEEWGLKLLHEPLPAADAPGPASGTAYLAAKREAREAAERARTELDGLAAEVHARLAEHADAAVVGRPQDRRLSGHEGEMLLNGSYLVPVAQGAGFRALVEQLDERYGRDGLTFQLTGPWAPYHFAGEVPQA
jgi:gas vesicle protein GvpL/GvpF